MTRLDDTVVLFDWNGTIVLDADRARQALNSVLGRRGLLPLDSTQFADRFRLPMKELFRDLGIAEDDLARCEAQWNRGMLGAEPRARAGASRALGGLRTAGALIGVVSAASAVSIDSDLAALGLDVDWDVVRGGVADKVAVLRAERGDRSRAFYVGDTAYDIESACAAGYRAIGVSGGYTSPERLLDAGAELIVADLGELMEIVAA